VRLAAGGWLVVEATRTRSLPTDTFLLHSFPFQNRASPRLQFLADLGFAPLGFTPLRRR
jgi:hypothetical protein